METVFSYDFERLIVEIASAGSGEGVDAESADRFNFVAFIVE